MTTEHRACLSCPGRSLAALLLALPLCLLAPASFSAAPQRAKAGAAARPTTPTQPVEPPKCENVFTAPGEAIKLAWREKSEQRLDVVSADRKPHTLRAQLGDFALRDAAGNRLTTSKFIKVEPETLAVPETAAVSLFVSVTKPEGDQPLPAVRSGVYSGSLLLSAEGEGAKACTQRLGVQVTVADAAPLSDKLTLHAYRLVPFLPYWHDDEYYVPLRGPLDPAATALSKDTPLGGIQNKDGGAVAVYWTGKPSIDKDGVSLLPVSLSGLGPAGQYDGELRLGPSDAAPKVSLMLDASDIAFWPILVIALSTWCGLLAQRFLNVRRPILRLREQEAALGVAFEESNQSFARKTEGTASADYSIADDFERRSLALRQKLGELQAGAALTLDTASDPFKAVNEEFRQLRQAVAAWPGFADALAALRGAASQNPGPPPQGFEGDTPALVLRGAELLAGRALAVDEFTERAARVRAAAAAVRLWLELKDRLAEDQSRAARLRSSAGNMTVAQLNSLDTIESALRTARLRLWRANSPAALESLTMETGDLDMNEDALEVLEANVVVAPAPAPAERAASARAGLGALRRVFARESAPPDEPADDRERRNFYAATIRRWDVALTVLAFVIATLTALHSNYFGKSFGSLRDYLALVMLGLGTKLAVDILGTVLGSLLGGRLPARLGGPAGRTP